MYVKRVNAVNKVSFSFLIINAKQKLQKERPFDVCYLTSLYELHKL